MLIYFWYSFGSLLVGTFSSAVRRNFRTLFVVWIHWYIRETFSENKVVRTRLNLEEEMRRIFIKSNQILKNYYMVNRSETLSPSL